jgi:hypothetical protein
MPVKPNTIATTPGAYDEIAAVSIFLNHKYIKTPATIDATAQIISNTPTKFIVSGSNVCTLAAFSVAI